MVPIEYHSACALNCPDICAYVIEVDDGIISRLKGDPDHRKTSILLLDILQDSTLSW